MARRTETATAPRVPLTRERVLRAAIALADEQGIDALSMRKLGQAVGVEAMSLYNHAASKDEILDGILDLVLDEIESSRPVPPGRPSCAPRCWPPARSCSGIRGRPACSNRGPMPDRPRCATWRPSWASCAGVASSLDTTHHAMHALGSRVFGFEQELFDEMGGSEPSAEVAAVMAGEMTLRFPYLTELAMAVSHEGGLGGCDDDIEFAFGLDLILDGLERSRDRD